MAPKDLKKLARIEARINDVKRCNPVEIEEKKFVHITADIVTEAEWLAQQLRKAIGPQAVEADEVEEEVTAE